jgi:glycosyltransferase involved in cell wall biosynthesis
MRIAISSVSGPPLDPRTWSNAPANLCAALVRRGVEIVPIDSRLVSRAGKLPYLAQALWSGLPAAGVSWSRPLRQKRARFLARQARAAGAQMVLCTGTLDAPLGQGIPYAIWFDNTWNLLRNSDAKPDWRPRALDAIDALEREALAGAAMVLPFSRHVRDDVIAHYDVPPERVQAVGCGSGPMPPFTGAKDFASGHLLFVAKHLFVQKGGELVLEAFRILRMVRPQSRLVLIGNDEARRKAAGIEGVEVHGYVERDTLNGFFRDAAMLVQPMLSDPWGQVHLEAMKARAVVVALDRAALPELTEGGKAGVLVREASPAAIANAVLKTWQRPQAELDAMTLHAQALATAQDWDAVADRVARGLADVLANPRRVEMA